MGKDQIKKTTTKWSPQQLLTPRPVAIVTSTIGMATSWTIGTEPVTGVFPLAGSRCEKLFLDIMLQQKLQPEGGRPHRGLYPLTRCLIPAAGVAVDTQQLSTVEELGHPTVEINYLDPASGDNVIRECIRAIVIAPVQKADTMIQDIGRKVVLKISFDLALVMDDQPVLIWPLHDRLCDASDVPSARHARERPPGSGPRGPDPGSTCR